MGRNKRIGFKMGLDFGVVLPSFGVHCSRNAILEVTRTADETGYYSVWAAERLIVPEPPNQPWSRVNPAAYEPLITLSFLASVIKHVKLGTSVLILPFRNPLVAARQITTLDVLSGGRVILGIGVGWMNEEFRAADVPMRERGARTDEAIRMFRVLWEQNKPSFRGKFTEFPEINFEPKPLQHRVPIWIGGNSDAALRRVARIGDGWLPMGLSAEEMGEKIHTIRRYAEKYKRPMSQITISWSCPGIGDAEEESVDAIEETLEKCAELGISHVIPRFEYHTIGELIDKMKIFSSTVIPSFQ